MKTVKFLKELHSFLLLWGSQTVSELGTAMTNYALAIWVYQQNGSASAISLLTLSSFLPTILFRFIGGALADKFDKKRILLLSDLIAALGSLTILVLYSASELKIWHLYVINALLSCMNAVQVPASFAACSMLIPKEHYTRAGGLQSLSGAAVSILAPALGGALLAFGDLTTILLLDIASFAFAFSTLFLFIRIPGAKVQESRKDKSTFFEDCKAGLLYLKSHKAILNITLFMSAVNFLAKLGNDGMLAPFILSRTNGSERILGLVQSSVSVGLLIGSLAMTLLRPAKNKAHLAFFACTFIYAGVIVQSLTLQPWLWCLTSVLSYIAAVIMNANLTTYLRESIPTELHGRVFSAKDTLQNGTIPLGLILGGFLADHVFEPMMSGNSPLKHLLSPLFGTQYGSGIAAQFFLVGILGIILCLSQLRRSAYKDLEA